MQEFQYLESSLKLLSFFEYDSKDIHTYVVAYPSVVEEIKPN